MVTNLFVYLVQLQKCSHKNGHFSHICLVASQIWLIFVGAIDVKCNLRVAFGGLVI